MCLARRPGSVNSLISVQRQSEKAKNPQTHSLIFGVFGVLLLLLVVFTHRTETTQSESLVQSVRFSVMFLVSKTKRISGTVHIVQCSP